MREIGSHQPTTTLTEIGTMMTIAYWKNILHLDVLSRNPLVIFKEAETARNEEGPWLIDPADLGDILDRLGASTQDTQRELQRRLELQDTTAQNLVDGCLDAMRTLRSALHRLRSHAILQSEEGTIDLDRVELLQEMLTTINLEEL